MLEVSFPGRHYLVVPARSLALTCGIGGVQFYSSELSFPAITFMPRMIRNPAPARAIANRNSVFQWEAWKRGSVREAG